MYKNILKKLNLPHQIIVNYTGYKVKSPFFVLIRLIYFVVSIFLREDVLISLSEQSLIKQFILIFCITNIIFIQFDLCCTFILIVYKGIPNFLEEIKIFKKEYLKVYFIGFIFYNLTIMFLSYMVLIKLYCVLMLFYSGLFNFIYVYNLIISYILTVNYLKGNFNSLNYSIDYNWIKNINLLQKILLLTLPAVLVVNFSYILTIF
nr:hypothetical protein [Ganoderma leucocontextum]